MTTITNMPKSYFEKENGELNNARAPGPKILPNFRKWGLVKTGPLDIDPDWSASQVSDWVSDLFPNVWKHPEQVAASSNLFDTCQPPWVLLHKENRRFAIVRTCGEPDGWDLLQVRSKGRTTTDEVILYLGKSYS